MYDVIIIGAGITGSFIAHNLSRYNIKILVLEKEYEVCNGISKANSAIIHSGYDPKPGSLKAKLNVLGNERYDSITKELHVDFKRIGSYTLAFNDEEESEIKKLYQQGIDNHVSVEIVDKEELLRQEPNINPNVKCALYAKTTGILSPWELVDALLENAIGNGVKLKTHEEVLKILTEKDVFTVQTKKANYQSRYLINACGLYAEHITQMVTPNPGFQTIYTKGEYYVLDKGYDDYVKHVIYPTPSVKGKGVLIVPTIHGNILLGPTSEQIDGATGTDVTKKGLSVIKEHVNKMILNTPYKGIIRTFSGVRPKTTRNDFIIEALNDIPHFIQVAGIDSPGLASAPAIAQMVEEILLKQVAFPLKEDYQIKTNERHFNTLPIEERNAFIKEHPQYGHIICRCETISEGEVMDAMKGPLGAKTIDGIKRKLRPGAGRCQGGFCQPLILSLLAKEWGLDKTKILLNGEHSELLIEETKKGGKSDETI